MNRSNQTGKIFRVIFFAITSIVLVSCGGDRSAVQVANWGPQSLTVGAIPNKQPDGGMGLWVEVTRSGGDVDYQIYFNGAPQRTSVTDKGMTTSIPPSQLTQPGNMDVTIKHSATGRVFSVGTFVVKSK